MDIKNLPKTGQGFRASFSKPGQPSLQKTLGRLRIKNSAFRNLSKGNIATIASVIKPAEKSIRLKGGMSKWQVKSASRKLWKTYKETKGSENEFSKEDIKDAKKIISTYRKRYGDQKSESGKKVIPFRPYLDEEQSPRTGITSVNQLNKNVDSINDVTGHSIYGIKKENTRNVVSVGSLLGRKSVAPPPPTTIAKPFSLSGGNLSNFSGSGIPKSPNRPL